MSLPFTKMSGAGNDFILIEKKSARGQSLSSLARLLCPRRTGVGADGLLALENNASAPRLRYFNADGSEAFCGNGARCAALWLYSKGWTKGRRHFQIASRAGLLRARITGPAKAAIAMPHRSLRLNLKLKALGKSFTVHSIDTGVPHAVLITKNIEHCDVELIGKALRNHKEFKPKGTNVDFLVLNPSCLQLRTYERGVEGETLACGTGAVAAALVAAALGKSRSPVSVWTRGGDILKVSFKKDASGAHFSDIQLEGPARIVYSGEVRP